MIASEAVEGDNLGQLIAQDKAFFGCVSHLGMRSKIESDKLFFYFVITHSPQPHRNSGYTIFGQVIEGRNTVNRIARGDRVEHIEISEPR